jgi:hypothetical protein
MCMNSGNIRVFNYTVHPVIRLKHWFQMTVWTLACWVVCKIEKKSGCDPSEVEIVLVVLSKFFFIQQELIFL